MKPALRSLLLLIALSAAAGGVWWWLPRTPQHWWRDDILMELHDQVITVADLEDSLRSHIWRSGQDWPSMTLEARDTLRRQLFEDLIGQRLLRLQPQPGAEAAAGGEFQAWRKQFQTDTERAQRLQWQGLSETQVEKRITEAQAAQSWLESQIKQHLSLPTDKELHEWFATHRESLRIPVAHRASHIYLTRHEKEKPGRQPEIEALHQKLTAGTATFAELAAQYSEDDRSKKIGGDLGWFTRDRMPTDFIAAVEALKPGQTSAPVLTQLGWHIIHLQDRHPSRLPNFEEVRAEVEAMMVSKAREDTLHQIMTGLITSHEPEMWRCNPRRLTEITPAADPSVPSPPPAHPPPAERPTPPPPAARPPAQSPAIAPH